MRIAFATFLTLLATVSVVPTGHSGGIVSGISNGINNAFTFREDQKERVAPRRNLPPKVIQVPNFNQRENAEWARTYTRQDLAPMDYMAGSASKVMRPDPRRNGANNTLPGGGRLAMLEGRARANAANAANAGRVYIGQPGTGPGMRLYDSNIGKKTAVGDPQANWRDGQRSDYAQARAGDYNYNAFPQELAQGNMNHKHGNSGHSHAGHDNIRHRTVDNIQFHDNGVNDYTVQRGDSLTEISEQPQVYGNWKLWPLIKEANRAAIGQNAQNIYPNQKLDIPRNLSDEQVRGAVRSRSNW